MENITPTNYAGFGKRLLAYLLDAILLGIVLSILMVGIGALTAGFMGSSFDSNADPSAQAVGGMLGMVLGTYLLMIIVTWLYFAKMQARPAGATVGKMALNIRVTNMDGGQITFGQATGRFFSRILSSFLMIGYIMAGFTDKQQALHDIIAKTLVINND